MSKHLFKLTIKEVTTLSPISKEVTKRAGLTFLPGLSRKMAKHHIQMVPKASGKLSQVLGSPKNVVDERAKSGFYEI
jgi:archaeosine-15-forming tRNA-guanine transglycosylase